VICVLTSKKLEVRLGLKVRLCLGSDTSDKEHSNLKFKFLCDRQNNKSRSQTRCYKIKCNKEISINELDLQLILRSVDTVQLKTPVI